MALAIPMSADEADGRARPAKHASAFRTISEVAEALDVPQHVLRFWEGRFAQVRPVKRAGGRRYYRPEDVDLLKGIRRLLHGQGYTIRGAQQVLRQHGVRFVQEIGRGRAEADAPPPAEAEPGDPHEPAGAPQALPETDEATLRAVLADLEACRAALRALRQEAGTGEEADAAARTETSD